MIMKFLRGLGGGKSEEAAEHEAVDYKGFRVVATARKGPGGWTTEGVISKEVGENTRSERFIRADTLMTVDEAVAYSVAKAQKIIDEQGDRLLKG